jgi:dienelactone hydrolase
LNRPPAHEVESAELGVDAIHYAGEPYQGHPTRVFAYLGLPQRLNGQAGAAAQDEAGVPGIVLVHGGGGTAFREWVTLWNARGYAAIAMDLAGCTAGRRRLPDGGPSQEHQDKFRDPADVWTDHWVYHAAANVILAHSLLRAQPGVDPRRIGLTGISWGGFTTSLVAGLDPRFAFAVPVYGAGAIHTGSSWPAFFERMAPDARERWIACCDPTSTLPRATMPVLFVNGTNDQHYWLPAYLRSYALVPAPVTLCIRLEMPHSHPAGWAPPEIALFADHHTRGAPAPPRLEAPVRAGAEVRARVIAGRPLVAASLIYTADAGRWPYRKWHKRPATLDGPLDGSTVVATPLPGATAYFLAATDDRGAYASSPHVAPEDPQH